MCQGSHVRCQVKFVLVLRKLYKKCNLKKARQSINDQKKSVKVVELVGRESVINGASIYDFFLLIFWGKLNLSTNSLCKKKKKKSCL